MNIPELPTIVNNRRCGSCTLCCKVMEITELAKDKGRWCSHCDPGRGCRIYNSKPKECSAFFCGYLLNKDIGEHWKPEKCKMVLAWEDESNRIAIHVDPGSPNVWKADPFYSDIKFWAQQAALNRAQVAVYVNWRVFVVLPHADVDIGLLGPGDLIVTRERNGIPIDAIKMDRNDPRAAKVISSRRDRA